MSDLTPETIAELKRLEQAATKGPWEWMDAKLNDRLAKKLGKPRSKLSKRDGLLVYALKGPLNGDPAYEDRADRWDYPTVMELAWDQIKGDTIINCAPSSESRELIAALRNAAPALIAAAEECERLRGLLRECEDALELNSIPCPSCRNSIFYEKHAPDCRLAAAIKGTIA